MISNECGTYAARLKLQRYKDTYHWDKETNPHKDIRIGCIRHFFLVINDNTQRCIKTDWRYVLKAPIGEEKNKSQIYSNGIDIGYFWCLCMACMPFGRLLSCTVKYSLWLSTGLPICKAEFCMKILIGFYAVVFLSPTHIRLWLLCWELYFLMVKIILLFLRFPIVCLSIF